MVARIEDKTGQRASDTAQIVLENCRVPAENLLGAGRRGLPHRALQPRVGRINVAAQAIGMARAALEAALAYANERRASARR